MAMRYFEDRAQAGKLLAQQMSDYARQNCAVLALSEGGILVGAEIAKAIHASLFLLPIEDVLPSSHKNLLNSLHAPSSFNSSLAIEADHAQEITAASEVVLSRVEVENFLDQDSILSHSGEVHKRLLGRHTVVLVFDAIANDLSIGLAHSFLNTIPARDIIVATPICNAEITDRVHDISRKFIYMDNIQSEFPINHYFNDNTLPTRTEARQIMSTISLDW